MKIGLCCIGKLENEYIREFVEYYKNIGVEEGDYVVFVTANLPETIFSFYALNKIGAISTIVEPRMAKSRIEHFIDMVKAKTIILNWTRIFEEVA